MPLHRESLSFFLILFIISTTVLGILFVNAKRDLKRAGMSDDRPIAQESGAKTPNATTYPMPVASTYTRVIALPKPVIAGKMSVEAAMQTRRSVRTYTTDPVTIPQLSQMLWSGQGQTDEKGHRTAPSSRESYSMSLYAVVQDVKGLESGVYEYIPKTHSIGLIKSGDMGALLKSSSVQPGAVPAPVVFMVTSSFGTYQAKTKSSEVLGTYLEAGHIGQNMYLQSQSLGMGMVVMAGFDTKKVTSTFGIDAAQTVEYVIPFGKAAPAQAEEK